VKVFKRIVEDGSCGMDIGCRDSSHRDSSQKKALIVVRRMARRAYHAGALMDGEEILVRAKCGPHLIRKRWKYPAREERLLNRKAIAVLNEMRANGATSNERKS
jgi:hypothetical protein